MPHVPYLGYGTPYLPGYGADIEAQRHYASVRETTAVFLFEQEALASEAISDAQVQRTWKLRVS
jgi:hypothetical protein